MRAILEIDDAESRYRNIHGRDSEYHALGPPLASLNDDFDELTLESNESIDASNAQLPATTTGTPLLDALVRAMQRPTSAANEQSS